MAKILLASPRGFCAGVERAIRIVEKALEKYGRPVYVRHEIVHNKHVVEELEQKGAIFVEELHEVPKGNVLIFSAHGTPPDVKQEALKKGLKTIDAACPLVQKVHDEAKRLHSEGHSIILVGKKGHQEVIGTMGYAPMTLVSDAQEVEALEIKEPAAYITQTTLSVDEAGKIIDALKTKYPTIKAPPKEDICYATTNRQRAAKELAKRCELIIVIGAENSSNTKSLVETARRAGAETYRIDDATELRKEWLEKKIGITAGASVPERLVQEAVKELGGDAEETRYAEEKTQFKLPEFN